MSRVIYSGLKSFLEMKNPMEVTIVEHANHDLFEVVLVDSFAKLEADRIFVDAQALYMQLDEESGQRKKKNERSYEGSLGGIIVHTYNVSDKAVSTFICNHLFIKTYLPVSGTMKIEVRSACMEEEHNELMVPRPPSLPASSSPAAWSAIELPVRTIHLTPRLRFSNSASPPSESASAADRDPISPITKLPARSGTPSLSSWTYIFGISQSRNDHYADYADPNLPGSSGPAPDSSAVEPASAFLMLEVHDKEEIVGPSRSGPSAMLRARKESLRRRMHLQSSYSRDDLSESARGRESVAYSAAGDIPFMTSLAGEHITRDGQPSGVWPTSSPPSAVERRMRRHTYNPDTMKSLSSLAPPARATNAQHRRTGSGSILESIASVLSTTHHRRTGSGGLLAGIAGPSNRVQPCAAWVLDADGAMPPS
jgi:hypothetical protein